MAVWKLIFTIIFVKIVATSCTQYGSLTFVIDDTKSMHEEINKVIDAATRIYSHINQRSSQINNVVLVTFNDNDPDDGYGITNVERAKLRLTDSSKSEYEFANALRKIKPGGGGYCPEYCLTGTELALKHSLQNSYVFVFTDASPKDVEKKAKVIKDAQAKGSQIYFFLTTPSGGCAFEFQSPWKFQAYYDIASATNGQVFKLENKGQVDEVLHLLDIIISGEANVIASTETPANQYANVHFTVDDQTEYAVVSAAGKGSDSDVQLSLITGPTRTTERVVWLKGVKVLKINNPLPGSYAVSVYGTTSATVMIIGRTDFTFQHGFSETLPPTFRNDKKQPTDGLQYHLLVEVTDPKHSTDIVKALIEDKDGTVIDLPLKKMEGDYYSTGLFLPPNSAFTIKIVGVGKRTGKEITRMAKTPITPRPGNLDPVITTSGGGSCNYNSQAKLICKVKAHPKPEILWKDDKGNLMSAAKTTTLSWYDYVSELIINNVKKTSAYYCYAENSEGQNSARIDLSAESPFTIHDKLNGAVNVEYESPTLLECNIRSHLEINTSWYIQKGQEWNLIHNSEEYSILNNGEQLKINKVRENEEGKYKCVAAVVGESETNEESPRIVKINHIAPIMGKAEETRVKEDESTSIKCNILKAYPKPEIIWLFKKVDGADFQDLKISNVILDIKNANPQSTGTYKCIAKNDQGSSAHEAELTVLTKPTVILFTNNKEVLSTDIDYNGNVSLVCRIVSNSATKIVWKNSKNEELRSDKAESLNQHEYTSYLAISQMRRSETYTCAAYNEMGQNRTFVSIAVKTPFQGDNKDKAVEAVTVEYGDPTVLDCNIRSYSLIQRVWYLNNGKELKLIQNSKEYSILNNGVQLKINKVQENEQGNYICVASIPGDSETKQESPRFVKINHVAPKMGKAEETGVREGESTSIKCNILKAYPKPDITWLFKKSDGTGFQDLKISNAILDIKNANPQSTGTYTCIAKNDQGSNAHETKLTLLTKPTVTLFTNNKEISSTEIDYNGNVSLVCRIVSNSATKIVWKNSKNEELRSDNTESLKQHEYTSYLTIPQMKRSERYTCAAYNEMGENSTPVSIAVKSPFQGDNKDKAVEAVTVENGNSIVLDCNIRSLSQIKRVWYLNNGKELKLIQNSKVYSILNDGVQLKINKVEENEEGNYICVASTPDDSETKQESSRVVKINHVAPVMGKAAETQVKDGESTSIKCNILKAYPKPDIIWLFKKFNGTDFQDLKISNEILDIKNANPQSTGTYKCIAKNDQGSNAHETKLTLLTKPKVTLFTNYKEISSTEVDYNEKISLVCHILSNSATKIVWKNSKNEELGISDKAEALNQHEYTSYIAIPQMRRSERYTCAAYNEVGENSRYVSIVVKSPFEGDNKDKAVEAVTVEYGDPTVLDCNIRSHSQIKRVWYLNNGKELKFIQNSEEYSILNNGVQLKINKVEENEEGNYICVASIPDDSETKQESSRVVKINHVAPIMGKSEETRVRDGDSTSIKCNILKAYPKPEIIWLFKTSDGTDFQDLKISNVILDIKNANPQSTGTYKCIAKNDQGSNAHETKLTLLTKPTVTLFTNNKEISSTEIDYNGEVSLVCRIVSNSATKIVWKNSKNQELQSYKAESFNQHEFTTYLGIPQMKQSESYTCAATNDMGENSKVVSITVKSPFQGDNKNTFLEVKYGEEAKLTCNIKTQYPMNITWYNDKGVLLHTGSEFMIKEMNLNLQGKYMCKASLTDDESIQETRDIIVKIVGLKKPQIEKHTTSMDVRRHRTATLKCKILQGHPKPEVTWEAKTENQKEYTALNVSGDEISIKFAEYNDTGLYKCTATNVIGKDEFSIKLTVTAPPVILSDGDKPYSAVEGDIELRIPCEVIGYPKPTIQWKKGNDPITVGGQFEIEDGVLVINYPKEQNNNYKCLAVNDFGSAQKTFTASVTKTLPDEDLSNPKYIYMLEKETRNFECKSGSGKGRWFKEWNPTNVTGTLTLRNVAIRDSGNYTCRVSDRLGSKSLTYVVEVGFPPTFKAEVPSEDKTINNWKGKDQDLYCGVYMQPESGPTAKVEWLFNGKPSSLMSGSLIDSIHPIIGWGNYTCVITNYHGSVRKNFYVHSKGCLLHLDTQIGNSPLILDPTGKWPELSATSSKYLHVKPEQALLFSCHNQTEKRNAFKTLPSESELIATCNHEDYFQVDGKLYQYSNLQCSSSVEPLVQPTGEACGSKNTEAIKVGYNLQHAPNKFLEVYSVCLDKINKLPVYTVSVTSPLNAVAVEKPKWQTRTYDDKDRNYCDKDIGCCVVKNQLVNQMDVWHGPAQIATFNENLNSVFVWNNCKYSNVTWNEVEKAVNEFYDEAKVWTGAVGYSRLHTNGAMFPQYLWKIAKKDLKTETIVVVKVNNPSPRPEDILCATQCNSKIPNDKYTYCCSLQEFRQNFESLNNFN